MFLNRYYLVLVLFVYNFHFCTFSSTKSADDPDGRPSDAQVLLSSANFSRSQVYTQGTNEAEYKRRLELQPGRAWDDGVLVVVATNEAGVSDPVFVKLNYGGVILCLYNRLIDSFIISKL